MLGEAKRERIIIQKSVLILHDHHHLFSTANKVFRLPSRCASTSTVTFSFYRLLKIPLSHIIFSDPLSLLILPRVTWALIIFAFVFDHRGKSASFPCLFVCVFSSSLMMVLADYGRRVHSPVYHWVSFFITYCVYWLFTLSAQMYTSCFLSHSFGIICTLVLFLSQAKIGSLPLPSLRSRPPEICATRAHLSSSDCACWKRWYFFYMIIKSINCSWDILWPPLSPASFSNQHRNKKCWLCNRSARLSVHRVC